MDVSLAPPEVHMKPDADGGFTQLLSAALAGISSRSAATRLHAFVTVKSGAFKRFRRR